MGFIRKREKRLRGRSNHWRCFMKKVFLKLSQNPQENICWSVFFNNAASQITSSFHPKRLFFLNMGHCANTKRIRLQILGQVEFLFVCVVLNIFFLFFTNFFFFLQPGQIWDKVFKSGLSKFCGREPSKNLLGPLLNSLSHIIL